MPVKITRAVLEAYLNCKYKAYLKLTGQQGTQSDYETLRTKMRAEVRLAIIDRILARHAEEEIPRCVPLTVAVLRQGASFLLDATLDDDKLSLHFDGLKRVDGKSDLGDFHYIPILYHEGRKVQNEQRVLLGVYGVILGTIQGKTPAYGIIWHGKQHKSTKVGLTHGIRKVEKALRALKGIAGSETTPRLLLNEHCQVCEFRQQCHAQAVEEDNLSLLLGMGEKAIAAYNRKGFFTVTQLSYTFRYRKPRKRAKVHEYPHYYSLQARSIRTGIVHVHGNPSLPKAETKVYFDIEGIPERDFYYLIGVIVEAGQSGIHLARDTLLPQLLAEMA